MNRKFLFWSVVMACCAGSVLTSCSDDTVPENSTPDAPGTGAGTYVVAATVDGVNYLLTAESLDEGSVTVKNNGLETETGTYWVFHNNDYLFRLVYNKGGDGTGSSYILNSNNKLEEHLSYAFKRITTYGTWGDNVITASTGDTDRTDAGGYAEQLVATVAGGSGSGAYKEGSIPSTQYPDHAYVAIYSGNDFSSTPTIVATDKIGFASGRMRSQYYQTIWAADNGDLYVFSPGYGRLTTSSDDLKRVQGTLPSGVMRIKAGETSFDDTYYVNLEELGNKHPMYKCWHITEDYFLLQMYTRGLQSKGEYTTELAVFKGEDRTLKPVTGLPSEDVLSAYGNIPYNENGYIYMPVSTTDGSTPALYKIDPRTATATKGLTIIAESVSTVGKLTSQK